VRGVAVIKRRGHSRGDDLELEGGQHFDNPSVLRCSNNYCASLPHCIGTRENLFSLSDYTNGHNVGLLHGIRCNAYKMTLQQMGRGGRKEQRGQLPSRTTSY